MNDRTRWILIELQNIFGLTNDETLSMYISQKNYFDFSVELADFLWEYAEDSY
jgi:hypothetical protein